MTDELPLEAPEDEAVQAALPEITITLRRVHIFAILLPLTFILGLAVGYFVWGRVPAVTASEAAGASSSTDTTGASSTPQQVVRYEVPIDDDPALGPQNAAITIIEFSDYECPYCRRWHSEVYPNLRDAYAEQVRFVYRDFPLSSIHPNAFPAAEAANCANEQGAFWDFHEMLFSMELGLGSEAYQRYADRLGMDASAFSECIESGRFRGEVQADYDFAAELGVRSTPTFFINGIAVVGAQPFEVFQQIIEKELAGEIP